MVIGYYILKSLLNILATPFISCNAKYSPVAAWSAAPFILSGRRMHFAALITITALLMAIVHMSFATDFRLSLISFLEPPLQFSIALYAASVISTFLLSCGETLAVKQVRNLQNLATPIKVKAGRERRNSLRAPIKRDVVVERAKRITGAKRETVAFSPKDLELIR